MPWVMAKLDVVKERIAYLKLWLGILVVTDISMVSWFFVNYATGPLTFQLADLLAILFVSIAIAVLHQHIQGAIEHLKDL